MLYDGGSSDDLSAQTYRQKQEVFSTGNIRFVACSDWLADIARRAPLLQGHTVESITNPIDTSFYSPGDKRAARRELGLPEDRRLLLFVAYKATDRNKGIHFLRDAVRSVCHHYPSMCGQLGVVPVGREAEQLADAFACPAYPQTYVSDEARMRQLYRAADVLVMPTLADNLPNTVAEAMACGVPCVAFRVGGLPQMIDHEKNGYLVRYKDVQDLEEGILSTLFSDRYAELSAAARKKAEQTYSERVVAGRFLKLYEDLDEAE